MVDHETRNGSRNLILQALSKQDYALLQPDLTPVPLPFRRQLQNAHRTIGDVFFPESGLASVVAVAGGERKQAEVAMVGFEGMTGLAVVNGTDQAPCEIFIQVEGAGLSISAGRLRAAMDQSRSLVRVLLLYSHVFTVQAGFTALANARGDITKRLARWLLMARDRLDSDEMLLTHEFLSLMLGVRRAGVSMALGEFERRALVSASRGAVTILDRGGLEEAADGLYGAPEAEFERVFG